MLVQVMPGLVKLVRIYLVILG